jgi:hypothetical protein
MYDEDGHYTGIFDRNIRIIEELLIPRGGIDGRYLQFQQ